jgi:hypothetical protein
LSAKVAAAKASVPLPPIRNKVELEKLKEKKKEAPKDEKELKRDITPMFDYYKAWDKFAVEEEEKNVENKGEEEAQGDFIEAKNPKPDAEREMSQAEIFRRSSGAKPNTKLVIKGGTVKKSNMAD